MTPENNTNNSTDSSPQETAFAAPPVNTNVASSSDADSSTNSIFNQANGLTSSSGSSSNSSSNLSSLSPHADTANAPSGHVSASIESSNSNFMPSPATNQNSTSASVKPKKSWLKMIIFVLLGIIVIGGVAALAYSSGKSQSKTVYQTPTPQPINLPLDAKVISECETGRGKQYIETKNIPAGPIYDVVNNKVIAIEYLMGIKALFGDSDKFSSTILSLSKNYPVDHFAVVPVAPKRDDTDQYMHLIMFVVPKNEASAIKCSATSSSTSQSTTPATTTTTTTRTN